MQGSSNRSIVVISGLLTLLILGGATLGIAFHNGWLRTPSPPTLDATRVRAQATDNSSNRVSATLDEGPAREEVVAYQQKLDDAYRALDDAYAQIRVLQTPPAQLASGGDSDERFAARHGADEQRERRSHRRDSDDE